MKFKKFKFVNVTSTNDVAIKLIKEKNKKTGYVYAYNQTKGRGTHGKKWISKKGNLFGSIFFPLKKNYPDFSEFSIINPIIISRVIENFCENKNISFKWPNDILVNKKKICGILQELITSNNKKFLIIGMGINIKSNPYIRDDYKTTSIYFETKKKPSILKIINLIINAYEDFFFDLQLYKFKKFKRQIEMMAIK